MHSHAGMEFPRKLPNLAKICIFLVQDFLRKLEITLLYLSGHFNLVLLQKQQPKPKKNEAELLGT